MDNLITKLRHNYLLFILVGAASIFIFAYSWVPGGLDSDSCNYAAVAKEVLRTHKWLGLYDPVYQGVFYYHFPLCIWVTAGLFKLMGTTTFAAKLFSMLSGVLLVAAIYYLGRLLKNHWAGFFGALSFLLTNHIVRLCRQCRMDIPVSLFITLAIFSFILAQKKARLYYLLFGLFSCLAILTKDVVGLAPLVIGLLYLVMRLRLKELFHPLCISGLLIAIIPVWIWIWLDHRALFYPWLHHNFLHLLKSPAFTVPWYYYIWAIATKYFYFLPFALYGGYLAIKEAHKKKEFESYLLVIWILLFPLAFSFGRQKLHYFILPIYPAASVLVGIAGDNIFRESAKEKIASAAKYILIIASIIMLCIPINMRSKRFAETVRMAPAIDQILRQLSEYEFIVYNQDAAAVLFYSQELSRVKSIQQRQALEDTLTVPGAKPKLCYMSEGDYLSLNSSVRENCQVVLKYKDKIMIINPKNPGLIFTLP